MKNVVLIVFAISMFDFGFAQEINWLTWQDMVKEREKFIAENQEGLKAGKVFPKKIYIDVYTDWCGWCKRMDATTFKDPVIIDIMNKYYYPVKMDAEMSDTISFNGHNFVNPNPNAKRSTHQMAASLLDNGLSYPSYVILDENIARLAIYKGFKQPDDLLGILLFFGKNNHLVYSKFVKQQVQLQQQQQQQQQPK